MYELWSLKSRKMINLRLSARQKQTTNLTGRTHKHNYVFTIASDSDSDFCLTQPHFWLLYFHKDFSHRNV